MSKTNPAGAITAAEIERVECEAWLDLFDAAPAEYTTSHGVTHKRMGNAVALAHRTVPITEFNRIFATGLSDPWTETDFDGAMEWLQQHAANGWAIQISPGALPDEIAEWLTAAGLKSQGNGWAKWHQSASQVISSQNESNVEVRRVDRADGATFAVVVQQGFGLPESTASWFATLPGRPGWHTYLAFDNGKAIAAATMFVHRGWAWLGVDTTLANARRKGAQRSLIARRLADGLAAGVQDFTAETANPSAGEEASYSSFRNYRKAGFSVAYVRPNYKIPQPE